MPAQSVSLPSVGALPSIPILTHFVSIGFVHEELKRWKHSGFSMNQERLLVEWRNRSKAYSSFSKLLNDVTLVPIPQAAHRSWSLGGSPSLRLSLQWKTWLPQLRVNNLLSVMTTDNQPIHLQSAPQRRWSQQRFSWNNKYSAARVRKSTVWLADDFFTTGTTLAQAQELLMEQGIQVSGMLVIGYRPKLRLLDESSLQHEQALAH